MSNALRSFADFVKSSAPAAGPARAGDAPLDGASLDKEAPQHDPDQSEDSAQGGPNPPTPSGQDDAHEDVTTHEGVPADENGLGDDVGKPTPVDDKSGDGDIVKIIGEIIQTLKDAQSDITLTFQTARALPEGKTPGDFSWDGPAAMECVFPTQKSLVFGWVLAAATVEVRWFYDGKYINDFGARLTKAQLDGLSSGLDIDLKVDHIDPHPAKGIARIDWILTFTFKNNTVRKIFTSSGFALGNGTGFATNPSDQ
jgi:hypothetical protein